VSHPPADTVVEALLRDLGPRLRRGGVPGESLSRLPTGIPDLDRLLGGGFPRGRLAEIAGPASSGRTSLALALLAHATRAGELAAWIDGADALDPASAAAAGALLERVLWARPPLLGDPRRGRTRGGPKASEDRSGGASALRCARCVLEAGGFGLVLVDPGLGRAGSVPAAAAARLARAAAAAGTALVWLGSERALGAAAEIALALGPARPCFTGTPPLLEALQVEATLVRHRSGPTAGRARLRLPASRAA